jgi:hypothetical protein
MTLDELQTLVMRQAVAKLERLRTVKIESAGAEQDPRAERPKGWIRGEYLQEQIDDQELLIAKLIYNHEREQAELTRVERMQAIEMSERLAHISEIEHLIEHRREWLAALKDSTEIQRAGLAAIAEAIKGHTA